MRFNPLRLLKSVIFGICLMVGIGTYVGIGSGFPQVREFFEMNEMQFFNAWPLITMMLLLVVNLTVVTFDRIPFTPPRYGVWMVHTGIIVLTMGLFQYFSGKVEGLVRVHRPESGAMQATKFYNRDVRALHARITAGRAPTELIPVAMPSLPRFKAYAPAAGNGGRLDRGDLRDQVLSLSAGPGRPAPTPLHEMLGMSEPITADVLAYYPYAEVTTRFESTSTNDPDAVTAIRLGSEEAGQNARWLCSAHPSLRARAVLDRFELVHHHFDEGTARAMGDAARKVHQLDITVDESKVRLFVEPGQTYKVGKTDYQLQVESFDPTFPTMSGEQLPLLTLLVTTPTQAFRRMIMPGRPPTDWVLDGDDNQATGKRQNEPIDANLKIDYTFNNDLRLVGPMLSRTTIITASDSDLVMSVTTLRNQPAIVDENPPAITFVPDPRVPEQRLRLAIARMDNMRRVDSIVPVPRELRQRDETGIHQVMLVRVKSGSWERTVPVWYTDLLSEHERRSPWRSERITLPGSRAFLELTLAQHPEPLPRQITLRDFEAVNYPGGLPNSRLMRDFRSHITLINARTGDREDAVVSLNDPVYFDGLLLAQWTYFQAMWDPNGQRWTVLGVGNRPGVTVMLLGSVLIVVGLFWAFYLKPIIIRRMKERALAEAAAAGKMRPKSEPAAEPQPVPVETAS